MDRKRIDSILLAKARGGNQKAFSSLFSFYYQRVFTYVKIMVCDYTEAEDLAMITFEKAFMNISKFVPMFEFQTWLFKIAKNTTIDFIKRRNRNPESVDISTIHYLKSDIENSIEREEDYLLLEKAVSQLDEKYRAVIELYYYEECSYKAISSKLCIPINTVCGHMLRAKLNLNKLIKKQAS
jgi:RNA polymerase sigma-70 factor (ECF subfamily)